jgi:serine/tyrosine/threonine adenylyltransferase
MPCSRPAASAARSSSPLADPADTPVAFDNSYARLPERFFARVAPARFPAPALVQVNAPLAQALGIDPAWLAGPEGLAMVSGQHLPAGADPIATAYAGHQFGGFVPQLGDGRAILLGEVIGPDGARRDIQLKGAGLTPFSRRGDGRAALGPVLREYVVSEAMAALGIPTTRALAAVTTGERVQRETDLPGAVLTRVASSHIRVGTFQFFAARQDVEALRFLADHAIARHHPEAAEAAEPYQALLGAVVAAQARLVAAWLLVGFVHGVMNTDNCSIAGETIDYGPCAFLDSYDPAAVYSSIDQFGRYAYGNQPRMAHWNLARLAEAMLPLLHADETRALAIAEEALSAFGSHFQSAYNRGMARKLGLATTGAGDAALAADLLSAMAVNQVDFTLCFRKLAGVLDGEDGPVRSLFVDPIAFDRWAVRWRSRLEEEPMPVTGRRALMQAANPNFIPRNHRIEAMIRAAVDDGDLDPFRRLHAVLSRPYEDQPEAAAYADPPLHHERVTATFCGT